MSSCDSFVRLRRKCSTIFCNKGREGDWSIYSVVIFHAIPTHTQHSIGLIQCEFPVVQISSEIRKWKFTYKLTGRRELKNRVLLIRSVFEMLAQVARMQFQFNQTIRAGVFVIFEDFGLRWLGAARVHYNDIESKSIMKWGTGEPDSLFR